MFNKVNLLSDMDFRDKNLRQEVFMKFYEYHLELKAHPGGVYFVIPYLVKRFKMSKEQELWFVYLLGCTQNTMTAWMIYREFTDYQNLDLAELETWHWKNWKSLAYDTDRRYQKGHLVKMVTNYQKIVGVNQLAFFERYCPKEGNECSNFRKLWKVVKGEFFMFGRLSTFSYLEYLRIAGINLNCDSLFLEDMSGSLSHRNGILKVYGCDDKEQHKKINPGYKHGKEVVCYTQRKGRELLLEAKNRFAGREFIGDVNYFTLESTLCCFKSWFRVNRRYPNVYIDMMHDRIVKAKELGIGDDANIFWDCRKECLPDYSRDAGVTKKKQNHFRETGDVLFLGNMFPENFRKGLEQCL